MLPTSTMRATPRERCRRGCLSRRLNATGRSLPVDVAHQWRRRCLCRRADRSHRRAGVRPQATGELRERDEIADAIGVPVLASIPVRHPCRCRPLGQAAGGVRAQRRPCVAAAQCSALSGARRRGYPPAQVSNGESLSVAVLSLSSDRRALALGPQLAVFAASLGIPTALVVGPQQDMNATAALRAACEAPPSQGPSSQLRLAVADEDGMAGA